MSTPFRFPSLLVAAAVLAGPAAADGPNLASNPGFDSGISGWGTSVGNGTIEWSLTDAQANPHSGSARIVNNGASADLSATSNNSTCVPYTPGTSLVVGGSVYLEPLVTGDRVGVQAIFFANPSCLGVLIAQGVPHWTSPGWSHVAALVTYTNPAAKAVRLSIRSQRGPSPSGNLVSYFDNVFLRAGTCAPGATSLCLANGRFRVAVTWKKPDGTTGDGQAVPFSSESGSFWFFSPTNLELDVKVLDACSYNNRFWVFAAGLTNVDVTLAVTDTKTGTTRTYHNPENRTFVTITDTNAFSTCP